MNFGKYFYFLIPFFVCFSCHKKQTIHDSKTGNSTEFTLNHKGQKNGPFKILSNNEVVLETGNYLLDSLDGEHKIFSVEGKLEALENFKNGKYHGVFQKFYPDGKIQQEGLYQNNVMTGVWKKFYANGKVIEEVMFSNNNENGPFKEFYDSGILKAKGQYKNGGNEDGLLELYDSTGTLIRKMLCNEGICRTIWSPNNKNTEGQSLVK
jgi:antitoxin component YwqK of YwqJK toxin-antitoxin module